MSFVVNGTPSAERWNKYDAQTELKAGPDGKQVVDHGKSAIANLKAAGQNLLDTVDPTNHFRDTWSSMRKNDQFGFGTAVATLMLPWDAAREVLDLPGKPIAAVKNLTDAIGHGVMAGVEKLWK